MKGLVIDFTAPLNELEMLDAGLLVATVTSFCFAGLNVDIGWEVGMTLPT
jgi:hypothetical protein